MDKLRASLLGPASIVSSDPVALQRVIDLPADARWFHSARTVIDATLDIPAWSDATSSDISLAVCQLLEDLSTIEWVERVSIELSLGDDLDIRVVGSGQIDPDFVVKEWLTGVGYLVASSLLNDVTMGTADETVWVSGRASGVGSRTKR